MRRKIEGIILITALLLIGLFLYINRYDFSDWKFEKYQTDFETVAQIIKGDYEKLDVEKVIYLVTDGNVERFDDVGYETIIESDVAEIEKVKAFRKFKFDGIDAHEDCLMFIYGGQEYIIHTYDGKKPDYSFLKGQDFYTGKLADGWYVAKLRLR